MEALGLLDGIGGNKVVDVKLLQFVDDTLFFLPTKIQVHMNNQGYSTQLRSSVRIKGQLPQKTSWCNRG